MKILLLVMFLLQGEQTPFVIPQEMPNMKACEAQAHIVGGSKIPKVVNGKQVNGMGALCLRVLPSGHDI